MKPEIENYFPELLNAVKAYCDVNGLDKTELPKERGTEFPFWCWNKTSATIVAQNPNAQPELGMMDDANLPFPILIVHREKQADGSIRYRCEETEYTRKYL